MRIADIKSFATHHRIAIIVGLGCILRLTHYLRNPAVWHDEAALIINVLEAGFYQAFGPLIWHEAAPPLFLWIERAAILLLGDSTYALRLVPLLASCASLVLFAATVRRTLPPLGAFWAVFLLATSERLLWHACEAKPYALDVLIATMALFLHQATRHWPLDRRMLLLTLLGPVAIFLSYPACFVCGGLLLVEFPLAIRARLREKAAFVICCAAVCGAFAALYFGPIRAQRTSEMEGCWTSHFPDWQHFWTVPWWGMFNTAEVARYCFMPTGFVLLPLGLMGGVAHWRQGVRGGSALAVLPLALAFVAACLRGYPYGGSRLEVFAAPGLALLIGAGAAHVYDSRWGLARLVWAMVFGTLLVPITQGLRYSVVPWPRADTSGAAAYILANWKPGDGVCANHWEYVYYLRHVQPGHDWLDQGFPPHHRRVWVAVTSMDDQLRRRECERYAGLGSVRQQRDFEFSTVLLVELGSEFIAELPRPGAGH